MEHESIGVADALVDFAAVLWDERERLDALCAALSSYARAQRTGDEADLAASEAQVRINSQRLQTCEVMRAANAGLLGDLLGLDPDPTLRELAVAAPEPWPMILGEHREALRELTREIAALAAETGCGVWQRSLAEHLY
jgi:hypothetical protein